MKQKISFFNKENLVNTLHRYWWLGFITLVVFFLAKPLALLIGLQQGGGYDADIQRVEVFLGCWQSRGGLSTDMFLAMFCAFVFGLTMMNCLHDKKQVNFYLAQPIRRESLLLQRVLAAILLFAMAYAANVLLAVLIAALKGLPIPWMLLFSRCLWVLLAFALLLSVTFLAGMLTGTAFAQFEMTALILGLPMLLTVLVHLLMSLGFATYLEPPELFSLASPNSIVRLCPPLYLLVAAILEEGLSPLWQVLLVMLPFLCLGLALLLFRLRPAERAGNPLVFSISQPIVRLAACLAASLGMGLIFCSITYSLLLQLFGFLLGAFLCHMFCQAQFYKNPRAMFWGLPSLGVLCALVFACLFCLNEDVMGFDRYRPQMEELQSVAVRSNKLSEEFCALDGTDDMVYLDSDDPRTMEAALAMVDAVYADMDAQEQQTSWFCKNTTSLQGMYRSTHSVQLRFTLKNGRQIYRVFRIQGVSVDLLEKMNAVWNQPDYLALHLSQSLDASLPFQFAEYYPDRLNTVEPMHTADPVLIQNLFAALAEDVRTHGVHAEDMVKGYLEGFLQQESHNRWVQLPVRASYTKTLDILEQLGWNEPYLPDEFGRAITSLRLHDLSQPGIPSRLITDPEQLNDIFSYAQAWNDNYMDPQWCFVLNLVYKENGNVFAQADLSAQILSMDMNGYPILSSYQEMDAGEKWTETENLQCFGFPMGQVPDFLLEGAGK